MKLNIGEEFERIGNIKDKDKMKLEYEEMCKKFRNLTNEEQKEVEANFMNDKNIGYEDELSGGVKVVYDTCIRGLLE